MIVLMANSGSADLQADLRWKFHDFIIWSWGKQQEILLEKSLPVLKRVETEEISY